MPAAGTLRFLRESPPQDGSLTTLLAGVEWLRLPLPFALNHVNIWLLENPQDGTLSCIDAGFPLAANKEAWHAALGPRVPRDIFITHCHPDHLGLAGWLSSLFPATRFLMTAQEEHLARALCDDATLAAWLPAHVSAYQAAGLDDARLHAMLTRMSGFKQAVMPLPEHFDTVKDGDDITLGQGVWRIMTASGHSPEHASLYCRERDIFIAGDMVLPSISPNISLTPRDGDEANPLDGYLRGLARIKAQVPDTALVLPSHGLPFHGLHGRIDALIQHHHDRCAEITRLIKERPLTAVELMEALFSKRAHDPATLFFALGETLAHVRYLERLHALRATSDGDVIRYSL